MRTTKRTARRIVPLAPLILAGCFSLSRETPVLEQYVLGAVPVTAGAAAARDLAGLTIALRRPDLAPYLAIPAIVVRRGPHQIVQSEFHRWGENAAGGINRAVAGYLSGLAPFDAVDVAPWPVRSRYHYLIQLHVSRFEGVAPEDSTARDGEAHLLATWEIIGQQDGAVLARGATDYREPGWRVGDYAGLVTLLDRGLSVLAHDLVTCLGGLAAEVPRTATAGEPPHRGPARACTIRSG